MVVEAEAEEASRRRRGRCPQQAGAPCRSAAVVGLAAPTLALVVLGWAAKAQAVG